jgi:uncharacterized protein
MVGLGLVAILLAPRLRISRSASHTTYAGIASGCTSAITGAGGPALILYAMATRWPQETFAATIQLSFATQAGLALSLRGLPTLEPLRLGLVAAAVLSGLAAGQFAAARVRSDRARRTAVILAALATCLVVVKGAQAW